MPSDDAIKTLLEDLDRLQANVDSREFDATAAHCTLVTLNLLYQDLKEHLHRRPRIGIRYRATVVAALSRLNEAQLAHIEALQKMLAPTKKPGRGWALLRWIPRATSKRNDRLIAKLGWLIPRHLREGFAGDLREDVEEMRAAKETERQIRRFIWYNFFSFVLQKLWDLLANGILRKWLKP